MYRTLDPSKTLETLEALQKRIQERFPESGLSKVCQELCSTANATRARAEWIARPNMLLRCSLGVIIAAILVILMYSVSIMDISIRSIDAGELVQLTEAALNDLILIGAAIFFLTSVELRIKRSRALVALHELRSIAHVIDMHQLTKDPARYNKTMILTPSSPQRKLSAFELARYLDYCSEMLSLTGKVAALYAQVLSDSVVLVAVNEIENLTTALSRKIWQKIMILEKQVVAEDRVATSEIVLP